MSRRARNPQHGWRRARSLVRLASALAVGLLSAGDAEARGKRVRVVVVDVAGGRAYLSAGESKGLRLGDRVRIAKRRFQVVAVNQENAAIELGRRTLRAGQRGVVRVAPQAAPQTFETRPKPRPPSEFAGSTVSAARPADSQSPKYVPLGMVASGRNRALLQADYALTAPLGGEGSAIGRTRLRARLHYELSSAPVTLDLDGFSESWHAGDLDLRPGNPSRPLWTLRQLEFGYRGERFSGAAGRLRYASTTLGQLDGVRAGGSLNSSWSLSAFGGTLANPLDGGYSTEASRFGTELRWQGESAARPLASLTLFGSRFQGAADERRALLSFEAFPEQGRVGAQAQLSLFHDGNPWGARALELTWVGLNGSFRVGAVDLQASLDARRPDRSRRVAAYLPTGYFCALSPLNLSGATPPLCQDGRMRLSGSVNAVYRRPDWVVSAGSHGSTTRGAEAHQLGGFANLSLLELLGAARVDLGASASTSGPIERAAATIGISRSWQQPWLDASLYYRPAVYRYPTGGSTVGEQGIGGRLYWGLTPSVDLQFNGDLVTGADNRVLLFYSAVAYRPRF